MKTLAHIWIMFMFVNAFVYGFAMGCEPRGDENNPGGYAITVLAGPLLWVTGLGLWYGESKAKTK